MTLRMRKFYDLINTLGMSWIIWVFACTLFGLIRVWGVEDLPALERVVPFNPPEFSIEMILFGTAMGIPFGILDFFLNASKIHRLSYWKIITIKTLSQMVLAIFSLAVLVVVNNHLRQIKLSIFHYIFSKSAILWIIYTSIVSFLIYFLQVVKSKFGARVMVNLILGKYHNPRVETRIFMFLDMKDSTTHGENLGHIKFSSLIQDCFSYLTSAIVQHKVEVYQYVGDEAILTWQLNDGFEHANCLKVYYGFMDTLNKKKTYYENKYGIVPYFKAGVHLGDVTVSEVGVIKREIAYHSDVLNTAARIQSKCNELESGLLISEDLKDKVEDKQLFDFEHIGGISLKGKQHPVNIYKVTLR